MEYTQNYQLPLWDKEDSVKRTDFNESNEKIDAALKIAAEGNCKIAAGSYVGTGTYGADNPNTLTFEFEPKLVLVFAPNSATTRMMWTPGMMMACTDVRESTSYFVYTSYSENTLSWYNENANLGANKQLNGLNNQYFYIVFG